MPGREQNAGRAEGPTPPPYRARDLLPVAVTFPRVCGMNWMMYAPLLILILAVAVVYPKLVVWAVAGLAGLLVLRRL